MTSFLSSTELSFTAALIAFASYAKIQQN